MKSRSPLFFLLWVHWRFAKYWQCKDLHPEIKWPNDILLSRKKVCGVLAESIWTGDKVDSVVLGIGLNIKPQALPPADQLDFPATCLEAEAQLPMQNVELFEQVLLLQQILQAVRYWRVLVTSAVFLHTWERRLAFRGEQVEIWADGQVSQERAAGWPGAGRESAPAFSTGPRFLRAVWGSALASGCVIYFFHEVNHA